MRKKRRSNKTIYIGIAIAIAGLLSLLGVALIGANSAIHTAERTAERTLQYLREQCISYQDIIAADRVKSLVRLTEQVQELTDRDRLKGRERSNEGLAEYAQQQRISCVLVLNDALEPVYSYGVDMDWSDLYTDESVSNVMQYPEKIFARRLTRDGVVYDVAAAARTVEPGMVFCVRRQSSAVIASYHTSIESLLAGYETLLNEKIYTYITDGEKVIGSSDNGQWNLPVDSVPLITALEQADSDSCLTRLDCGGTFFGMRRMYQEYSLYVFLPADFVFTQTKNMLISAFGVYAAAAVVMVLLLVRLGRDRKRRELAYQKQLEKEVERATAADQAKTHFLRSMSHDIRTPINIIMGMLEIIGRNPEDVTLVQSCREKAQTAARYLLALANDVLTLNRPKREALGKTPYCLTSELHELLDISRAQAESAGVALTVMDLTLEHEQFTGDPLYVRQICQNIIGNAIKYNHPGGWVRCSFRESRDADGVCRLEFICEDNGAGMSETFQRHMFEAFAQENSDRGSLSGGVGLGLAVVKKLVDERGGTIQVDSARGQGTRFRVVLPMMPSEAEEPEAALPDAAASIAGRRLLVAEDNELNREIAVYLLQEAGAMVDQAADGKEAVEMFAASAPGTYDAVLMDVMMPELDGHAAARAIRGMDRSDAQLPIIAMTANLFDEDVAACLAAGMDAHIPKPLEAGQMIKTIAEWLERKKQ